MSGDDQPRAGRRRQPAYFEPLVSKPPREELVARLAELPQTTLDRPPGEVLRDERSRR